MGLGRLNGHIQGGTGRTQFGAAMQGGKCKVELYRVEVAVKMQSGIHWRVEVAVESKEWGARQGMRGALMIGGDMGEGSVFMSC